MSTHRRFLLLLNAFVASAFLAATALAKGQRFTVTAEDSGEQVCYDVAAMLPDSGYTKDNTCHWRFRPHGPNAESPRWTPIDISKHMAWLRDISTMDTSTRQGLTSVQSDALWEKQFKDRDLADLRAGKYRYEGASFDMTDDGKAEYVLARSETKCPRVSPHTGSEDPGGPKLYVVLANGRLDRRYRNFGEMNPFFYRGKTYFLRRNYRLTLPKNKLRPLAPGLPPLDPKMDAVQGTLRVGRGSLPRSTEPASNRFGVFETCTIAPGKS